MKTQKVSSNDTTPTSNLIAFNDWLEGVGVTAITGWRWRKKGWIQTVNIYGRIYVKREAIASFECRAEAGEFAQKPNGAYWRAAQ
ncbi:MAG: hypothetical protein EXS29_06000 [Pedosphaera sp.]|nr:hypothetical protein [Pedosphaera sp.]